MDVKRLIRKLSFISIFIIPVLGSGNSLFKPPPLKHAHAPGLKVIYYHPLHEYAIPHLANCFMNSFSVHKERFGYESFEDVVILLQDFGDYGHGGADALPTNNVSLGIGPFSYAYETMPAYDRFNWLMHHELVHIVTTDMSTGRDRIFRSLFGGKVSPSIDNPLSIFYGYLTTPRRYSPRWYHEGMAVFVETWMAGGYGRVMGGYDEMVFRTKVRDDSHIYDMVGLESEGKAIDFQVGVNSYLYGTRFMSYLANSHGPDKLMEWVTRKPGSKPNFISQFKLVYDENIDDEWSNWIESEREFQRKNLELLRQFSLTPYRPISKVALGSISRVYHDKKTNQLIAGVRYPGKVAHVAAINLSDGSISEIHDIEGPTLFTVFHSAYDNDKRRLFYSSDNAHWRDLKVLDLNSGISRMLIEDLRAGDFAFNPKDESLWGMRHSDGYSSLIRLEPPYNDYNSVHVFDFGDDLYDLDISPDGSFLSGAYVDAWGQQVLVRYEIDALIGGQVQPDTLWSSDISSPANFVFSPDGRYLYGSTFYTGVSNIFRFDTELDTMEVISNSETGFFRPVSVSDDSVAVMMYTGDGFQPVLIADSTINDVSAVNYLGFEIAEKYPELLEWETSAPDRSEEGLVSYDGAYSPLGNLGISSFYPVVQAYKDQATPGIRVNFLSKLGLAGADLTATVTPDNSVPSDERYHLNFNFRYFEWKLSGGMNSSDFYDLFGPTKRSRKGNSLKLSFGKKISREKPISLDLSLSGYWGLERLPNYQNIDATFDRFYNGSISLSDSKTRKSLGAVDEEQGYRWDAGVNANFVNGQLFPRAHANLHTGIMFIKHAPFWLRTSIGNSFADREDPQANFANFYFGGFGNNWFDFRGVQRFRDYYSFPGVDLNHIGGTNFARVMGEWILPPLRFRQVGSPMFFFNWARTSVFMTGIVTNFDSEDYKQSFSNLGVQFDIRMVLFSHLKSTFSVGFAKAKDKLSGRTFDELMISLQILD